MSENNLDSLVKKNSNKSISLILSGLTLLSSSICAYSGLIQLENDNPDLALFFGSISLSSGLYFQHFLSNYINNYKNKE